MHMNYFLDFFIFCFDKNEEENLKKCVFFSLPNKIYVKNTI